MAAQADSAVRTLITQAGTSAVDVLVLSYGEIAVALHIAGLPVRWRQLSTQALIDLAADGITKVGLDEVVRIDAETRRITTALHHLTKKSDAEVAAARRLLQDIWISEQRKQNAIDAAWTIFHPLAHAC